MRGLSRLSLFIFFGLAQAQLFAQCPAVGADSGCGVVITIIATGNTACPASGCTSISYNQGPYDMIEDTLIGVVNSSNLPVSQIVLSSGTGGAPMFAFDGDGICGIDPNTGLPFDPAPAGCPFGPTGYEGPGTTFGNISPDGTTGTVFFSPAIPAGGSAYFSLEESLTSATACSDVVNGSVATPAGGGTTINASFLPNLGYTIAQAATLCGFTGFDWQQTITHLPDPSPFCANNTIILFTNPAPFCGQTAASTAPYPLHLTSTSVPFNDPVPNGYTYGFFNSYPFYYPSAMIAADETSGTPTFCITHSGSSTGPCVTYAINATNTALNFFDSPSDPCLAGGALVNKPACGNTGARAGAYIGFTLHLAGIKSDGSAKDLGVGFSWTDNYNGGSSGSVSTGTTVAAGGGGTGSATITAVSETTNYQYPTSFGVIGINGNTVTPPTSSPSTLLTGAQVSVTASGLAYSRVTGTFDGTLTITNVSASTISGPFQLVLDSLPASVGLANATSTFGGWSFITVPAVGSLAAGQSAKVNVQFSNPSSTPITFSPLAYSGAFN